MDPSIIYIWSIEHKARSFFFPYTLWLGTEEAPKQRCLGIYHTLWWCRFRRRVSMRHHATPTDHHAIIEQVMHGTAKATAAKNKREAGFHQPPEGDTTHGK